MEAEQVQLDAEAAVVAQLGLLPTPEVLIQLLLRGPDGAVDSLEHRALRVTAPVRAGDREQLECADLAGAGHMRTLAQVDERAVFVGRGGRKRGAGRFGAGRQIVQDLDLERLIATLEEGPTVGERDFLADESMVGGDGGAHGGLDGGQIVGRERARQEEVVVEAVVDRRADPELRAREDPQHRLGHHVRGGMAHRVQIGVGAGVEKLFDGSALDGVEELLGFRCLRCADLRRLNLLVLAHPVARPSVPSRRNW